MKALKYGLVVFGLLAGFSVFAEETEVAHEVRQLSLDEVISEVIRANPDVQEARANWLISVKNTRAAWGEFEPELVGRYTTSELDRENNAVQRTGQGGDEEFSENNEEWGLGLEGKLLTGGTYRIGGNVKELQNSLNVDEGDPDDEEDEGTGEFLFEYESFMGVTLDQPLLKGLWFGSSIARIRIAWREHAVALHEFRKKLMSSLSRAQSAYWNLVYAQEQFKIASDSVEIAKNLVADGKERVETGKMSELDLMEAEAGLALRETQLEDSEQKVREAMAGLKILLSSGNEGMEDVELFASETLESAQAVDPRTVNPEPLFDRDLQPDYKIEIEELEKQKIILGFQKGQVLPQVNLTASYGFNGLGETETESIEKLESQDWPTWSVGVEARVPLFMGIQSRNELGAARLRKKMAEDRLIAREFEIKNTVQTLVHRARSLRKQIDNAKKVADFRTKLLEVELQRMETGKSNSRLVYEAEEELFKARRHHLESILRFRETAGQLAVVRGSILQDRGLENTTGDRIVLSAEVTGFDRKRPLLSYLNPVPLVRKIGSKLK